MIEKIMVIDLLAGMRNRYSPSRFEMVPMVEFLRETLANSMGLPVPSVIFPNKVALLLCPCERTELSSRMKTIENVKINLIAAKIILPQ